MRHLKHKVLLSPLLIIVLLIVLGVGIAGAVILGGSGILQGNVDLQKGLIGHWNFTGNMKDATPYGHDGTSGVGVLAGYSYRKQITINATSSAALTNYQMKIIVNKGTGTDSSTNVYLANHSSSWTGTVPNDIRFTKSDGSTQLDYWIETSDANTATVWVEFDSISASSSTTNFYLYYGKSSDTTTSSGDNTFVFFDDFDDNSLDAGKWTTYSLGLSANGTSETGQQLDMSLANHSSNWCGTGAYTTDTYPIDSYAIDSKWNSGTVSNPNCGGGNCGPDLMIMRHATNYREGTFYGTQNQYLVGVWPGGSGFATADSTLTYTSVTDGVGAGTWYNMSLRNTSTSIAYYVNDAYKGWKGISSGIWSGLGSNVRFEVYYSDASGYFGTGSVDNFRVRKYHPTGPVWGTWGSEEAPYSSTYPLLATDRRGTANQAYNFNGTNDSISAGNVGTGIKTISFWMQADDTTTRKIINLDGTDQIELDGSSNITATSFPGTTTVYVDGSSSSANIPDTNWHFVTITDTTGVSGSTFGIGAVSGSYFDGKLDDVRVYNRVLNQAEITALYQEYHNPGIAISDLQKGLVGDWKFSGNAKDSTPYSNDGTVTGVVLATDRKGTANQAYNFNGTSDKILVSDSNSLDMSGGLTLAAWIYYGETPSSNIRTIIAKDGTWSGTNTNYQFDVRTSGKVEFAYRGSDSSANEWTTTNAIVAASTWQHLVLTYDGTNNPIIYLNGVAQAASYTSGGNKTLVGNSQPLYIGVLGNNGTPVNYFIGKMDDVRIYNRALTQTEITSLYGEYHNPGIAVSTLQKGLVGNWKFAGNMKDATPYGNNGTVGGGSPTLTTDRKGTANSAYSFNGTSDYMLGSTLPFTTYPGMTVGAWVTRTGTGRRMIVSMGYAPWQLQVGLAATDRLSIEIKIDTTYYHLASAAPTPLITNDGGWHHIAFTHTLSTGTWTFYVDGVAYTTGTQAGSAYGGSDVLRIGVNTNLLGGYWQGSIDDVRIYNRALSQAEITALYQSY